LIFNLIFRKFNRKHQIMSDTEYLEETYDVEKIVGHRPKNEGYHGWKDGKIRKYFIKWRGYTHNDNTWEDASHKQEEVPEAVEAYWRELYPKKFLEEDQKKGKIKGRRNEIPISGREYCAS